MTYLFINDSWVPYSRPYSIGLDFALLARCWIACPPITNWWRHSPPSTQQVALACCSGCLGCLCRFWDYFWLISTFCLLVIRYLSCSSSCSFVVGYLAIQGTADPQSPNGAFLSCLGPLFGWYQGLQSPPTCPSPSSRHHTHLRPYPIYLHWLINQMVWSFTFINYQNSISSNSGF